MPRQNRVRPDGQLIAVPDRGLFWGNRGALLNRNGDLARHAKGRGWIVCLLAFKGRQRTLWVPGKLTELFFLDEATAFAAGHRPCGECRIPAYRTFQDAWRVAHPGATASAPAMDARLHADRLTGPGVQRTYRARLAALPDGAMVQITGAPWLVHGAELLRWSPAGYGQRQPRARIREVTVLTPRAIVAALAAGYRPALHPSAE